MNFVLWMLSLLSFSRLDTSSLSEGAKLLQILDILHTAEHQYVYYGIALIALGMAIVIGSGNMYIEVGVGIGLAVAAFGTYMFVGCAIGEFLTWKMMLAVSAEGIFNPLEYYLWGTLFVLTCWL